MLVSHLEIVTFDVRVDGHANRAVSPTAVLTYPAFRGEGWGRRLNTAALDRIDRSGADIGLLTCAPTLVAFYEGAGWELAAGARVVAGPDEASWASDDVLLTRSLGQRSQQLLSALKLHPLRVSDEW
jgi:predicted acetyltransferase